MSQPGKTAEAAVGSHGMDNYGENYRPPRDGVVRIFTVYGYERDPEQPDLTLEPSVAQRYLGVVEPNVVESIRDEIAGERPDLAWVIEWTRLDFVC